MISDFTTRHAYIESRLRSCDKIKNYPAFKKLWQKYYAAEVDDPKIKYIEHMDGNESWSGKLINGVMEVTDKLLDDLIWEHQLDIQFSLPKNYSDNVTINMHKKI